MPLAPRFRALLVVASSLGAAACVPPADDPLADAGRLPPTGTDLPPADFTSVCEGDGYKMLENLGLSTRYDSLAAYTAGTLNAVTGTPCRSAKDPVACAARVEEIRAAGTDSYFVATDADGATAITYRKDLLAVLTPIRTPNAAILSLWFDGYRVECPGSASKFTAAGIEVVLDKRVDCGPHTRERLRVALDGSFSVLESDVLVTMLGCTGRRYPELVAATNVGTSELGELLGKLDYLEAASVHAFARLEAELAHHGAPAHLLKRIRRARRDEVRHAATMTRLAAEHGGVVPAVEMPSRPVPNLEEIARENRVEGCLRETYGAAVGAFQAARAEDPAIAAAMVSIARDEAAHAELSWAIDAWATGLLDGAARERLAAAYDAALAELRQEIEVEPGKTVATRAGIPTAAQASALLKGMLTVLATAA